MLNKNGYYPEEDEQIEDQNDEDRYEESPEEDTRMFEEAASLDCGVWKKI